jgi:hypothetical protein
VRRVRARRGRRTVSLRERRTSCLSFLEPLPTPCNLAFLSHP